MASYNNLTGWEDGNFDDTTILAGTPAIESADPISGTYSLTCSGTNTGTARQFPITGLNVGAGTSGYGKIRFRVRVNSAYPDAATPIAGFGESGTRAVAEMSATGGVRVNVGTASSAYSTEVLALDTDYIIELDETISRNGSQTVTGTVRLYNNAGTLLETETATGDTAFLDYQIKSAFNGWAGAGSKTGNFTFDDWQVRANDAADVTLTAARAAKVYAVLTTGNGASTDWTGTYTDVDEIPFNAAAGDVQTEDADEGTSTYTHPTAATLVIGAVQAFKASALAICGGSQDHAVLINTTEYLSAWTASYGVKVAVDFSTYSNANFNALECGVRNKTGTATTTLNAIMGQVIASPAISAILPATLPNGTRNAAYSQTITATGGTAPITFAVTAGSLPAGLSLASGGALTGTPTTVEAQTFTVTATDANSLTLDKEYTLTIDRCDPTVFIDSVDHTADVDGPLSFKMQLGSDWTCDFSTLDKDITASAYRPALRDDVVVDDGVRPVFHGKIMTVRDRSIGGGDFGAVTAVSAKANTAITDQVLVTETYAAGQTLKAVVTDLTTTYLVPRGITLDPAMATGATLEELIFDSVSMKDVLNQLETITGWPWRVTPSDVLEMFEAGTKTTAYNLTAANGFALSPVTWEKTLGNYCNKVTLYFGSGQGYSSEDFTSDGIQTTYVTAYPTSYNINDPYPNLLIIDGVVEEPIGWGSSQLPAGHWYWDYTNHTLVGGTAPISPNPAPLAAGKVVTIGYTVQYPAVVTAVDASWTSDPWERVYSDPSILDVDAAQARADGLLRQGLVEPRRVTATTVQGFVLPGDTITLTFATKLVSGSHVIVGVTARTHGAMSLAGAFFRYTLECLSGSEAQPSWTEQLRAQLGGGSASGSSVASAASGGSLQSAIPDALLAVRGLSFGGLAEAAYENTTYASVVSPVYREIDGTLLAAFTFKLHCMGQATAGDTVYVQLWDRTTSAEVVAMTFSTTTLSVVKSAAFSFSVVVHEYEVRTKATTGGAASPYNAYGFALI